MVFSFKAEHPYFWAKTTKEKQPGISVEEHMRIVGQVARALFGARGPAGILAGLTEEGAAFLASGHDGGKVTPGFQFKNPAWKARFAPDLPNAGFEKDHAKVTQHALHTFLTEKGHASETAGYLAAAVAAHHGSAPYRPMQRPPSPMGESGRWNWAEFRRDLLQRLYEAYGSPALPDPKNTDLQALAGLVSVADWIGSGEEYFPPEGGLTHEEIALRAEAVVAFLGFAAPAFVSGLSFEEMFPFSPNELQKEAARCITGPGLYVIEAPMGMGKTEAALFAAYGILASGKASGLYFALPTQVTSNRIHTRLADFLGRVLRDPERSAGLRLIHGASWLMENLPAPVISDAQEQPVEARDWFASSKRALLAAFGVGTLDQALLAVIGVRHHFVRRFALAGKVVILDEVHSYDTYTGTLLDALCKILCGLGCTVILLSATLTPERRERLLQKAAGVMPPSPEAYPLISGVTASGPVSEACSPPAGKTVHIRHLNREQAFAGALEAARRGARVLWVENTVAEAQRVWQALHDMPEGPEIGLLHSRFPFFQRNALETKWLELFGKNAEGGRGAVLVATQIVEQSVDLDADLLVSATAPTDMLLQRCGRLWRHPARVNRPLERAELWLLAPDADPTALATPSAEQLRTCFGPTGFVYEVYILLRSLQAWRGRSALSLPGDIRPLLQETYDENECPPDWEKLLLDYEGRRIGFQSLAKMQQNLWGAAGTDLEGLHTRLGGLDTVSLVLCREKDGSRVLLADGEESTLGKAFSLSVARALHRNLVKVPAYRLGRLPDEPHLARYVFGLAAFGIIGADGAVRLSGEKGEGVLGWTPELGVYRPEDLAV